MALVFAIKHLNYSNQWLKFKATRVLRDQCQAQFLSIALEAIIVIITIYSDLLQALKGNLCQLCVPTQSTLISASTVLQ